MKTMTIDEKTALVLEGGGLRGVFTCGVLDCFMDNGIRFPFTVGVSAGACNGLSYMSGQRGRAKASNIDLMDQYHYVGIKYLFTQRCIMDFKLLFEDFPERIIPYDYDTYFSNPDRIVMVTTNCLTGKAEYMEEKKSSARVMGDFEQTWPSLQGQGSLPAERVSVQNDEVREGRHIHDPDFRHHHHCVQHLRQPYNAADREALRHHDPASSRHSRVHNSPYLRAGRMDDLTHWTCSWSGYRNRIRTASTTLRIHKNARTFCCPGISCSNLMA